MPIQQAPIGVTSSSRLALAVADAGGVGTISALTVDPDRLARLLDGMTARSRGALAVNFTAEDVDEQAVAVAADRVWLVNFFWLNPRRSSSRSSTMPERSRAGR